METINNNVINKAEAFEKISEAGLDKPFIVANTISVSLDHLESECIIPVFSKDNETTIGHHQFIKEVYRAIRLHWPEVPIRDPQIRVSHVIKGRTPSAIGKPSSELLANEKTIYYERCAFLFQLEMDQDILNGYPLGISIGGVRAYNQQNLYSRKTLEKFKLFVGFRNKVCMNLCVNTDGYTREVRVGSPSELMESTQSLLESYDPISHREEMGILGSMVISEAQFAHLIGKLRMYPYLGKEKQAVLPEVSCTESQLNQVVRGYYQCNDFGRRSDGSICLWSLYNLLTEANKSSYIDQFLDRSVEAYDLMQNLALSLKNGNANWFLDN